MLCTYEYPSSSQETTKHFLAIVGGLHIISFSHYFWTQDIQRTGNLINNQSMHFDLIDEVNHHDFDANYHITSTLFSQIKVAKGHAFSSTQNPCISNVWTMNFSNMNTVPVHRGAFCQIPFWWIYYYGSTKSTGKETGKTNLCALVQFSSQIEEHWLIVFSVNEALPNCLH